MVTDDNSVSSQGVPPVRKLAVLTLLLAVLLVTVASAYALQESFSLQSSAIGQVPAGAITQATIVLENTGSVQSVYHLSLNGTADSFAKLSTTLLIVEPGQSKPVYLFLNPGKGAAGSYDLNLTVSTDFDTVQSYGFPITVVNEPDVQASFVQNAFENIPCSPTVYQIRIHNSGVYDEQYALSSQGFDPGEVQYSENPVFVPKGATQTVGVQVTPACSKYGWYAGAVTVSALDSGYDQSVPFYLHILQQYNFTLVRGTYAMRDNASVADFSKYIPYYNLCENVPYLIPLRIVNEMDFGNKYDLSVPSNSWFALQNKTIYVPAKGSKLVNLQLLSTAAGNYSIPVTVRSYLGDLQATFPINVSLADCYDYTLQLKGYRQDACLLDTEPSLYIENNGTKALTLDLSSTGITLANSSVTVPVGGNATVHASYPSMNATGPLPIDLHTVVSLYPGRFDQGLTATPTLYTPYDCAKVATEPVSTVRYYWESALSVPLRNIGIKGAAYNVTLSPAYAWMWLQRPNVALSAGQEDSLTVYFAPNTSVAPGLYNTSITLRAEDTGIVYTIPLQVQLRPITPAEGILLWLNDHKVLGLVFLIVLIVFLLFILWLGSCIATRPKREKPARPAKEAPRRRKRGKGVRVALWIILVLLILVLAFLGWYYRASLFPAKGNATTTTTQANMTTTTLVPNATTTTTVSTTTTVTAMNATTTTLPVITTTTLPFSNQTAGPSMANIFVLWTQSVGAYFSDLYHGLLAYTSGTNATTTTALPVTVTVSSTTTTTEKPLANLTFSEALARAEGAGDERILVAYIEMKGLTGKVEYQVWNQDTVHTLDLSKYFFDPDGDQLYYTFTVPEHINVTVENGTATFAPDQGWHGISAIRFTANDAKGGVVSSPTIYLIVVAPNQVTFWDNVGALLHQYVTYLIIGLLLLVIIFLLSIRRR